MINLEKLVKQFDIQLNNNQTHILNKFIQWLFKNWTKQCGFYMPYKPYAILTVCKMWNDNDKIVKINKGFVGIYANYIFNDHRLINSNFKSDKWQFINNHNKLKGTEGDLNNVLKVARLNLFVNPFGIKYKTPTGWRYRCPMELFNIDVQNETLSLNNEFANLVNFANLKLLIINLCLECIYKCTEQTIYDFDFNTIKTNHINWKEIYEKTNYRIGQAQWSQLLKHLHGECIICGESIPQLLEAAHIKPYIECETESEKYDVYNGLVLCANHHKIFDKVLQIRKENNEYVFYVNKNYKNSSEINSIINIFNKKINLLVANNNLYCKYFDFLAANNINRV